MAGGDLLNPARFETNLPNAAWMQSNELIDKKNSRPPFRICIYDKLPLTKICIED
jgi:hypothetical protein